MEAYVINLKRDRSHICLMTSAQSDMKTQVHWIQALVQHEKNKKMRCQTVRMI